MHIWANRSKKTIGEFSLNYIKIFNSRSYSTVICISINSLSFSPNSRLLWRIVLISNKTCLKHPPFVSLYLNYFKILWKCMALKAKSQNYSYTYYTCMYVCTFVYDRLCMVFKAQCNYFRLHVKKHYVIPTIFHYYEFQPS